MGGLFLAECAINARRAWVLGHIACELIAMGGVPLKQFVGSMVKDGLVTGPASRDQFFNDAFVGVKHTRASQKLCRLKLKLVRLEVALICHPF